MKIRATTLAFASAILSLWTLSGSCGDDSSGSNPTQACEGVTCSGHGTCALLPDESTICVCDPGFHSAQMDCVQDQPGEECSGVNCSGHGTCIVAQSDAPYPVCICDEGYHAEAATNCVSDQGGAASCGPGTHEESGVCIPDGQTPENFCMPTMLDDPGMVVLDSARAISWVHIAKTGDHFIVFYKTMNAYLVRTLAMDGTVGPTTNLDDGLSPVWNPAVTQGTLAAILLKDADQGKQVAILDDSAQLVTTATLPDDTIHLIVYKDGFAALHADSLLPVGPDGSLGQDIRLADNSGTLRAAQYDASNDRLAYAYTWMEGSVPDHLLFALADASDWTVLQTHEELDSVQNQNLGFSNPEIAWSGESYLLKYDAMIYAEGQLTPAGGDTMLHAFGSDGTETAGALTLGANMMFMNQLIFPGRFALLIPVLLARGPGYFWVLDANGARHPTGIEAGPIELPGEGVAMAGVAYSDKGAALVLARRDDITDVKLVFARVECR